MQSTKTRRSKDHPKSAQTKNSINEEKPNNKSSASASMSSLLAANSPTGEVEAAYRLDDTTVSQDGELTTKTAESASLSPQSSSPSSTIPPGLPGLNEAAVKIQSTYRGFRTRKELKGSPSTHRLTGRAFSPPPPL